jgi:predicted RNase H-like HicB family nuclease
MTFRFTSIITQEAKWYVARCAETGVVSQGKTIEEAQENLKEAMELFVEDMQPKAMRRFSRRSSFITSLDVEHA